MSDTPRHSVSVAAAIFDDSGENVLLIQRRDNGRWEPPGGVLELDETIEDGLRREVREETGLEIEIGPVTGIYKNLPRGIIALVLRCRMKGGEPHETSEARAVRWTSLAEARGLMTEAYFVRVSDATVAPTAPAIRTHDGTSLIEASQ